MTAEPILFSEKIRVIENHGALLEDLKAVEAVREQVKNGDILIAKEVFQPSLIHRIKEYLAGVGRNSFPNYKPIEMGCPNFHRINYWDERSYVKGCFHQFVFFPWNQDVFNFFELMKEVYYMKNLLSHNPKQRFMQNVPEDGCVRRLSFQFYPKGMGGMNKHRDPVDYHQLIVPSLVMSKKGKEFLHGGLYVESKNGQKICLDDRADIGDVIYFNAQIPHGVERIDPDAELDWISFQGRWTLLFAINKITANTAIANSVDLESHGANP